MSVVNLLGRLREKVQRAADDNLHATLQILAGALASEGYRLLVNKALFPTIANEDTAKEFQSYLFEVLGAAFAKLEEDSRGQ